jgi:periplasmic protein TonB
VVAILALIRAFAPDFTHKAVERVVSAFTVTVTAPEPTPTPEPRPSAHSDPGAAAPMGRKAKPKEIVAPRPKVAIATKIAPAAASTGNAVTSGARDAGAGTGAGGQGNGTGSGAGGNGSGAGGAKAIKIAGDISSARDYPIASREQRIDDYVIVAITVSAEGRPTACRVHRASHDAQANAITCRLAMQRFRFKPATDGAGNPVPSTYGWQQRWHY